ncbi:MAG: hypothetical protein ABSE63_05050 [Thermoguttaceae bacterium]|jgi:hypothetical protein
MKSSKNILRITAFALPLMLGTTLCLGQMYGDFYGGYGGYSWGDNRAVTAGQSFAYGIGDVIRSKGDYNLLTSQAAINATEADRNAILNRDLWTNTYFQMRREQRAAIAEEQGPRPSPEDLLRYAQMGKPKSLGPNQLDAASGRIYWPRSLRTDQFASSRGVLDELFAKRARYGDVSMEDLMVIRDETSKMINQLNQEIRDIPPMEYASAKQFISSLAYQVQLVAS